MGTLFGTNGSDVLNGKNGDDELFGFPSGGNPDADIGNDLLRGFGGADRLFGGGGNDDLQGGPGDDLLEGGSGDDRLDGAEGNDTASYADATAAVTVSLAAAAPQDTGGRGIDTLIAIENLEGGAGNDVLTGNAGDNRLAGNAGDDVLAGGAGDDVLDGGAGIDTASYAGSAAGVTVDLTLAGPQDTGGAGTDTLSGIENLTGGSGDDVLGGNAGGNLLDGGAGDDSLSGGAGDDRLIGGEGDDTLAGGDGRDVADYSGGGAVGVDLRLTGPQDTGGAGTDTLTGIEDLIGSAGDDRLTGDAGGNMLVGNEGDDILAGIDAPGGGGGVDRLIGGGGIDTADYSEAPGGVTVSLAVAGQQDTGGAGIDELAGIENLIGSGADDVLTGDAGHNQLHGGDGDDRLSGGGGSDLLVGGLGDDRLDGGAGIDTANYTDFSAPVTIDLGIAGAQDTGAAGMDTLIAVENVNGGRGDDVLAGNAAANRLNGRGGDDSLSGGGGNDELIGGVGDDRLDGGAGFDVAVYAGSVAAQVDLALTGAQDTGHGVDTLIGIEGLSGGSGDDTLSGDGAANRLDGGAGDDRLFGRAGNDTLAGGLGDDLLDGGAGRDTARYDGTEAVTVSLAITGPQDTGGAGTDTLVGIEGLVGGLGDDVLTGSSGDDSLAGSHGDDHLIGGAGDDILSGGPGDDVLDGGTGEDTASYSAFLDAVTVDLGLAGPQDTGAAGQDTLIAIESLTGGSGDDVLTGNDAVNALRGGAGNDVLTGGLGADRLAGGLGDDIYVFRAAGESPTAAGQSDRIYGFDAGDRIDLSAIDARAGTPADDAFAFIGAAAFDGIAGQLRAFDFGNSTVVEADLNGDRAADMKIVIVGVQGIDAGDFIL